MEVFLSPMAFHRYIRRGTHAANLAELRTDESGVLDRLDLPEEIARRLMELGFLPGHVVTPARSAPGGEPRVYRVDGSEVALRRETARQLILRQEHSPLNLPDGLS